MSVDEWSEIRNIVQRLAIEQSGFASKSFCAETERLIKEITDDDLTVALFKTLI